MNIGDLWARAKRCKNRVMQVTPSVLIFSSSTIFFVYALNFLHNFAHFCCVFAKFCKILHVFAHFFACFLVLIFQTQSCVSTFYWARAQPIRRQGWTTEQLNRPTHCPLHLKKESYWALSFRKLFKTVWRKVGQDNICHNHLKQVGEEASCMSERIINKYGDSEEIERLYEIALKATENEHE